MEKNSTKILLDGAIGITKSSIASFTNDSTIKESDEIINKRLTICRGCDKLTTKTSFKVLDAIIKNAQVCSECKCYIKLKVVLKDEKCPINKW